MSRRDASSRRTSDVDGDWLWRASARVAISLASSSSSSSCSASCPPVACCRATRTVKPSIAMSPRCPLIIASATSGRGNISTRGENGRMGSRTRSPDGRGEEERGREGGWTKRESWPRSRPRRPPIFALATRGESFAGRITMGRFWTRNVQAKRSGRRGILAGGRKRRRSTLLPTARVTRRGYCRETRERTRGGGPRGGTDPVTGWRIIPRRGEKTGVIRSIGRKWTGVCRRARSRSRDSRARRNSL